MLNLQLVYNSFATYDWRVLILFLVADVVEGVNFFF